MSFEVVEESDVMRATDRLVNRIRQSQQSKTFVFEVFILVIFLGVLANVIAEYFFRGEVMLGLGLGCIGILLGLLTYWYAGRYFTGAKGTFVSYTYRVKPKNYKSNELIIEELWKRVNPLSVWKLPHISSIAGTEKRPLFFFFSSEQLEKNKQNKTYNLILKGEFLYTTFRKRFWNKIIPSEKIYMSAFEEEMIKIDSCKMRLNLFAEEIEENHFEIGLSITLKIEKGIGPDTDELIQDIAVGLRSFKNNLYNSLLEISC